MEQIGAELQVRFVPPKNLHSITIVFPKPMKGSEESCTPPEFPLSLRVSICEPGGSNIIEELITRDRMHWTNWHDGPSLLLMRPRWFGDRLSSNHEYVLTLSVDSAVAGLGQAEVFLHWMDLAYVWGLEETKLQLTRQSAE